MFSKKYNILRREVKKHIKVFKKKKKITKDEFDDFINNVLSEKVLDVEDKIYCRDGFAYVNKINNNSFQILCFQINSFGAGIFSESLAKYCTPIMLTVTAHGTHHHLDHDLKNACVSIDDFYLGKHYLGSKGNLCDREKFNSYAKTLFLSKSNVHSFNHHIIYHLMNANYLCHHIAETMGYAFGALDICWEKKGTLFLIASGSWFNDKKDKLYINIIDNFSGEKMSGHFQIPHYAKLIKDVEKFKEEYDNLLCSVSYRKEIETFYLPIGYQKVRGKRFNKNINVITSQHILEHLFSEYYKRKNIFTVTNTFQTLEYLSRAMIAKTEGMENEFNEYMETVTSCMGYNPERNLKEFFNNKENKFNVFVSEYSHTMFFRAPVLK